MTEDHSWQGGHQWVKEAGDKEQVMALSIPPRHVQTLFSREKIQSILEENVSCQNGTMRSSQDIVRSGRML